MIKLENEKNKKKKIAHIKPLIIMLKNPIKIAKLNKKKEVKKKVAIQQIARGGDWWKGYKRDVRFGKEIL